MKFIVLTILLLATSWSSSLACECEGSTTTTPCPCDCENTTESSGNGQVPSFQLGLSNYWEMNGQLNDTVGNDNIETCVGTYSYDVDRFNKPNMALAITHAYCLLPADQYMDGGAFTLAMWFKFPDLNQTVLQLFYLSNNVLTDVIELAVSWDSGVPALTFMIQSGTPIIVELISQTTLQPNTWTHVAVTFDSQTVTLYINGVNDIQGNIHGEFFTELRNANAFGAGLPISVTMDDVRLYSRSLTSDEITALFNSPNVPPPNQHSLELSGSQIQCSSTPAGVCAVTCNDPTPYFYHENDIPCPFGERCCIAAPAQPVDAACIAHGGSCVQRDSCPVNDLLYVGGCDSESVIPICCFTDHYYASSVVDPFAAMYGNGSSQQCDAFASGCTLNGDCCSNSCGGGLCS